MSSRTQNSGRITNLSHMEFFIYYTILQIKVDSPLGKRKIPVFLLFPNHLSMVKIAYMAIDEKFKLRVTLLLVNQHFFFFVRLLALLDRRGEKLYLQEAYCEFVTMVYGFVCSVL